MKFSYKILTALLERVKKVIGIEIQNLGDSKRLSDDIFLKTGSQISYNTIRRLFGIVKSNQQSVQLSTLNILANYSGYKSYDHFLSSLKKNKKLYFFNKSAYLLENKKFKEAIKLLYSFPESDYTLKALLFNSLCDSKKYGLLLSVFENNDENIEFWNNLLKTPNLFSLNNFCVLISSSFKSINKKSPILLKLSHCKIFVKLYIHNYIDYSINPNHFIVLNNSIESDYNYTDRVFKKIYVHNHMFFLNTPLLNNSPISYEYSSITSDFVKGRCLTYEIINDLFSYNKIYSVNSPVSIITSASIITSLLITKNLIYFKKVMKYHLSSKRNNFSIYENDEWLWYDIHYPIFNFINNDFKSSIKNLKSVKSQIELLEKNQYRDIINSAMFFNELIVYGHDNSISKNLSESNSNLSFKKYTPMLAADIRKLIIKSII